MLVELSKEKLFNNFENYNKEEIKEICEKVFLEELYERTNIKKNKGIKVRSL